jgi:hypothetical protein
MGEAVSVEHFDQLYTSFERSVWRWEARHCALPPRHGRAVDRGSRRRKRSGLPRPLRVRDRREPLTRPAGRAT